MSKENPNELKIINKNERLKYQKLLYKYKQQIAELKAENEILKGQVEELNDDNMSLRKKASKEGVEILLDIKQQLKDNTKQVCEKIREFAYDTYKEWGVFDETDLEHILDQIENGE